MGNGKNKSQALRETGLLEFRSGQQSGNPLLGPCVIVCRVSHLFDKHLLLGETGEEWLLGWKSVRAEVL